MHDTLTIGIPVFVILFGILLNQRAVDKLEARMDARFNGVDGRLDRMQADLAQFYRILGEHEAKIEALMRRDKDKP